MVSIDEFLPDLRPVIPNAMTDILERSVIRSAKRFCKETDILLVTESVGSVVRGQLFDIPSIWSDSDNAVDGMELANMVWVTGNDATLFVGADYSVSESKTLVPFDNYDSLSVVASIQPKRNATEVPEVLYDKYSEAICSAVASYMYTLPEHMNPNLHQYHEREYVEQMRDVKRWRMKSQAHHPFSATKRNREFF